MAMIQKQSTKKKRLHQNPCGKKTVRPDHRQCSVRLDDSRGVIKINVVSVNLSVQADALQKVIAELEEFAHKTPLFFKKVLKRFPDIRKAPNSIVRVRAYGHAKKHGKYFLGLFPSKRGLQFLSALRDGAERDLAYHTELFK